MKDQKIKPNMVVHARGLPVATVDHLDGEQWIKLKKRDDDDGRHHWIPTSWVERVTSKGVHLSKTPDEFRRQRADRLLDLPTTPYIGPEPENALAEDGTRGVTVRGDANDPLQGAP